MDLTAQIIEAITAWLGTLTQALIAPALASVTSFLFATPLFDQIPEVQALWSIVRAIADALFVLVLLAAGIVVMTTGTFESRYSAKVLLPRAVLAAIAANASLALVGAAIDFDNALVGAMLGTDPGTGIAQEFGAVLQAGGPLNQYLAVFIGLWAATLAILLVALYIGRDLALLVGTVIAPFALALYALPQTAELARLWLRAFAALLFVQVVQAALVLIGLEVIRRSDLLGGEVSGLTSALVLVALLYLLIKLPFAAYHWAFRHSLAESPVAQPLVLVTRALRYAV
jgi:hypothetical protein